MKNLLIVDDERGSRESLRAIFQSAYSVIVAASAAEAEAVLMKTKVDLILLDVIMPEKDGIAFLQEALTRYPGIPIIMVSASTSVRPVVEAMRKGAFDFVTKPFDIEEIRHLVARAIESHAMSRHVENLQVQIEEEFPVNGIVARSSAFQSTLEDARKAADTEANVILTGENGTGKELLARLIHALSGRTREPFVPVHCGALPESLMESELFGHEKGSFTGADRQRIGKLEQAGTGTLFFDEVGDMDVDLQAKLLRVLQEKEFERVGGAEPIVFEGRVICATHRDLQLMTTAKEFREDLLYRIAVSEVNLPPLRERKGDIKLLIRHFLSKIGTELHKRVESIDGAAMLRLEQYEWPGNVRELENVLARAVALSRTTTLVLDDIAIPAGNTASVAPAEDGILPLAEAERRHVERALIATGWNITRTAKRLQISPTTLRKKVIDYGLQQP